MKSFDIERHATELEQDGYTVMHNVMSPSEIEVTKQAIEETLDAEEAIGRKYGLQKKIFGMRSTLRASIRISTGCRSVIRNRSRLPVVCSVRTCSHTT